MRNKKKLLLPETMSVAGWNLLKGRDDVEGIPFSPAMSTKDFHAALRDVHGVALGVTPFGVAELAAAPNIQVVGRIGVGYDAVDVPALSARKIPLMVTGIANSVSVAEQALYFMLALAKRGAALDAMVKSNRWTDRFQQLPGDLFGKTVLVIGFGRIGSRLAKRCRAMEMTVLVYDPYVPAHAIRAAEHEQVADLDAALPRADFVSIHCPKTPETVGLFDARRLARMRRSAFLVNTARGGIVDETALHASLSSGGIAGAALDVFDREPPASDNPLLKLDNLIAAPHLAGVTIEAAARMAVTTVQNLLDVLDGRPNPDHVINKDVLG